MAMVCCRVCKSTPIIFISASFVPSNVWLEHQHFTRLAVRPTSLCHQTGRSLPTFTRDRRFLGADSSERQKRSHRTKLILSYPLAGGAPLKPQNDFGWPTLCGVCKGWA